MSPHMTSQIALSLPAARAGAGDSGHAGAAGHRHQRADVLRLAVRRRRRDGGRGCADALYGPLHPGGGELVADLTEKSGFTRVGEKESQLPASLPHSVSQALLAVPLVGLYFGGATAVRAIENSRTA